MQSRPVKSITARLLSFFSFSKPDNSGHNPLTAAADTDDIAKIKALLAKGVDVNQKDFHARFPIHYTILRRSPRALEIMLAAGANPDVKDGEGMTALHMVAKLDTLERVEVLTQVLLTARPDLNIKNRLDYTPLMTAIEHDRLYTVRVLLAAGAKIEGVDDLGNCCLHLAQSKDVLLALLENGAHELVNIANSDGYIPLEIIISKYNARAQSDERANHYIDCVRALLSTGSNINKEMIAKVKPATPCSEMMINVLSKQLKYIQSKDSNNPAYEDRVNSPNLCRIR